MITTAQIDKALQAFNESNYANDIEARNLTVEITDATSFSREAIGLAAVFSSRPREPIANCLAAFNAGIRVGMELSKELK